jgi:hypothetical protein
VYVGEPFLVTVTWFFSGDIDNPSVTSGPVSGVPADISDGPVPAVPGNRQSDLLLDGRTVRAGIDSVSRNGLELTTWTFTRSVIPRRTGTLTIGSHTCSFGLDTGEGTLMDRIYEQVMIPSNSITVQVNNIPSDMAGADTGILLGNRRTRLVLSAEPDEVPAGEPLRITVRIVNALDTSGTRLTGDDLRDRWGQDFLLPDVIPGGRSEGSGKVWEIELMPLHSEVTSVPSLSMEYLNVDSDRVEILQSGDLPVSILLPEPEETDQDNQQAAETEAAGEGAAPEFPGGRIAGTILIIAGIVLLASAGVAGTLFLIRKKKNNGS